LPKPLPERIAGRGHEILDVRPLSDIGFYRNGSHASLFDQAYRLVSSVLAVEKTDGDGSAALRELEADASPDIPGTAGYDGNFASEVEMHLLEHVKG